MVYSMLTTTDNKFNPFTDWEDWIAFDNDPTNLVHQYFGMSACQMLDKVSYATSQMPPIMAEEENERAIDELCKRYWMFHIFKKVQMDESKVGNESS